MRLLTHSTEEAAVIKFQEQPRFDGELRTNNQHTGGRLNLLNDRR